MERKNIIILSDGKSFEVWGSIAEICKTHNLSYNYLKTIKFPFTYKGIDFIKVPFRSATGELEFKNKLK